MNAGGDDARPDPDALLARVEQEASRARRGKLKIFFGATAGVGKTFAMLSAARELRSRGLDVVVGVAETHGRSETAALLHGLECLAPRSLGHRGRELDEFDLDAALARRPALILIDELAHSNAPGSRHPKRWQDVAELLDSGIDVYSTVNVQHLESLNDVIGGITGVRVWETVPDHVFDRAEEVVLVDLPPDELLARLRQGKVYIPEQAQRALDNFFRKGNLIALRELALRRTADRVDEDMRVWRENSRTEKVWHTRDALLACVGPGDGGEKLVRGAARLAAQLDIPWHAAYAETSTLQRMPEQRRRHVLEVLKLAQDLGAITATLSANDAAEELVAYARRHNLTKFVTGRTVGRRWLFWRRPMRDRLSELAPDVDVMTIAREPVPDQRPAAASTAGAVARKARWPGYAGALGVTACAGLIALPLSMLFDPANVVMTFLLAVVVAALIWGRGPATLAAFANVLVFDFFFVPPYHSFAVSDVQYLFTFAIMLAVGLVIAQLMAGARYQARVASQREARSRTLYELARDLSAALTEGQVCEIGTRCLEAEFHVPARLLTTGESDALLPPADAELPVDMAVARWVLEHGEPAGSGTNTLAGSRLFYLPLKAPLRVRGVLVLDPGNARTLLVPERRRQLDTIAALIAIALERLHFVTVARETLVRMESERLRNSMLSALSHDLRTPLTAMRGIAETLGLKGPLTPEQSEAVISLAEQAALTTQLVNNLLDMARLESGAVSLRRDWQSVEELVGAARKARETMLAGRSVHVELPPDLPLVECDGVLVERVLVNLLENAAKYTPAGTSLTISAAASDGKLEVSVSDAGPGLPPGREHAIFEKFERGRKESDVPGMGLGLAISKAIVEAHGGRIWAENQPEGGARFAFTLPLGHPPVVDDPLSK